MRIRSKPGLPPFPGGLHTDITGLPMVLSDPTTLARAELKWKTSSDSPALRFARGCGVITSLGSARRCALLVCRRLGKLLTQVAIASYNR